MRLNMHVCGSDFALRAKSVYLVLYRWVLIVDDWIGDIMKKLEQVGMRRKTLVIFTSDHGEQVC